MAKGELDQVVPATTRDELGELAVAFNAMARTIREFQRAGTARLVRAQKTAQATIDSFPDPVLVLDPDGRVELANPAALRTVELKKRKARRRDLALRLFAVVSFFALWEFVPVHKFIIARRRSSHTI